MTVSRHCDPWTGPFIDCRTGTFAYLKITPSGKPRSIRAIGTPPAQASRPRDRNRLCHCSFARPLRSYAGAVPRQRLYAARRFLPAFDPGRQPHHSSRPAPRAAWRHRTKRGAATASAGPRPRPGPDVAVGGASVSDGAAGLRSYDWPYGRGLRYLRVGCLQSCSTGIGICNSAFTAPIQIP